eukprot:Em0012g351a
MAMPSEPARIFKSEWTATFPWLYVKDGKMFCNTCDSQPATSGHFVSGSQNFRISALQLHAQSAQHKRCDAMIQQNATNADINRMSLLFRNAHAIAKAGRPFSDFPWLCTLDEKKGLSVGDSYRNEKKCSEFIESIAEEQRMQLRSVIQKAHYFSIMVDGTTDSSVTEAEIMYIRYAIDGMPYVRFLAYVNISRANASTITESIVKTLEQHLHLTKQVIFERLMSITTDASVSSDSKAKAKGFFKTLTTRKTVILASLLTDAIDVLHVLSLSLQHTYCSPGCIIDMLNVALLKLEQFKQRPGLYLQAALSETMSFMGVPISGTYNDDQLCTAIHHVVDGLVEQLQKRLLDGSSGNLTASMTFLVLKNWPEEHTQEFGNEAIHVLLRHFNPILHDSIMNSTRIPEEWSTLKEYVYKLKNGSKELTWVGVNEVAKDVCPNVLHFVDLLLSLPASSADCERGFSLTKFITSDWRTPDGFDAVSDGFNAMSVQNVGSTYIIVSWDLPTHSNGILINFSLYCNGALAGVLPLTVICYDTTGLLLFTVYMYITLSVGQVLQSHPQALHSSWNVVLGVISAAASLPSTL